MRHLHCRALLVLSICAGICSPAVTGVGTARRVQNESGVTTAIEIAGSKLPVQGGDFALVVDGVRIRAGGTAYEDASIVAAVGFVQLPSGALRKVLRIRPKRDLVLHRVDVEVLTFADPPKVDIQRSEKSTADMIGSLAVAAFVEHAGAGAFLTLDFAYSEISWDGHTLALGYQPHQKLRAGEWYEAHSVTTAAYRLAGHRQGPQDAAAAETFRRYIRYEYAPPHLNAPQLIYTSIVNRFTEVDTKLPPARKDERPLRNTIFYTLSDANYYMLQPERMTEEIDFCKQLSMDFCQVYEGPFEWIAGNPAATVARRIGEYARSRGVRLGLYTGANQLTAPHFNHYGEDKGRPEWRMLDASGKRRAYCWGSKAFTDWFTDTLIDASERFNFHMANYDFLQITPCFDPSHGHALGEAGTYRQVRNVVECLDKVRRSVPGYVYDSNLGWPPLVPKIANAMDAFYLTDPHFSVYFPALNATQYLDDSRRYEMVLYYLNHLTPVEYFRNCEYYVVGDSVLHDAAIFEYGILQGLAVTPNLQLGEARALFDRLSPAEQEHARRFLARWTSFVRDHFDYYADTHVLSGLPKIGQVEIYAHAKHDRAVVFLVNPNPFSMKASFALDASIGLQDVSELRVSEMYPEARIRPAGAQLEHRRGDRISLDVPGRAVIVLKIAPPGEYAARPMTIAGADAVFDRFDDHYRITVTGPQGEDRELLLCPPDGESLTTIESGGQALNASPGGCGVRVSVQFPKERQEPEVLSWQIRPGTLKDSLQNQQWTGSPVRLPHDAMNFLGARVENLWSERIPVELTARFVQKAGRPAEQSKESREAQPRPQAEEGIVPQTGAELWARATFPIGFVQHYVPPEPRHQNYIALNFRDPGKVAEVRAWLNGKEARVESYQYWRGPEWARNYYINGSKSGLKRGENTLTLYIRPGSAQPQNAAAQPQ